MPADRAARGSRLVDTYKHFGRRSSASRLSNVNRLLVERQQTGRRTKTFIEAPLTDHRLCNSQAIK